MTPEERAARNAVVRSYRKRRKARDPEWVEKERLRSLEWSRNRADYFRQRRAEARAANPERFYTNRELAIRKHELTEAVECVRCADSVTAALNNLYARLGKLIELSGSADTSVPRITSPRRAER